jgi:hypothetical protein
MIALWVGLSAAFAGELAGGQAPEGPRVVGLGGTAVGVGWEGLVGPDGGAHAATARVRVKLDDVHVIGEIPFASYRVPGGRDADLGNVAIGAYYALPYGGIDHTLGFRTRFNVGENAYAYLNEADQVWPGAGLDIIWQGRFDVGGATAIVQGLGGIAASHAYAPFKRTWGRVGVSGALDADLGRRFGVYGEASFTYWDTNPVELSGLVRADLVEGLRVRGGVLLPVAAWAGWNPSNREPGLREATLLLDLSLAL